MKPKPNIIARIFFQGDLILPINFWRPFITYTSLILCFLLAWQGQSRFLGQLALVLLTVIIFTKPLVRLFPKLGIFRAALVLRRQVGHASGFAVLGHVATMTTLLAGAAFAGPGNYLFWGFWAFIFILPLLITSNDFFVGKLKRNWYYLHKLIHPLYLFAMLHYGLRGDLGHLILVVLVLAVLYLFRTLSGRGVVLLPVI